MLSVLRIPGQVVAARGAILVELAIGHSPHVSS
jgi:hypothetical protein